MTDAKKFYTEFIDLMKAHSNEIGPGKRDASMPLRAAAHCCGQAAAKASDPSAALGAILDAFQNGFNSNMALKAGGQPDPEPVFEAASQPVQHDLKEGEEYIHGATPMDNAFADAIGQLILHHSAMTNPDITMGLLGWAIGWRYKRAAKLSSYDGELVKGASVSVFGVVEIKCRTCNKVDHLTLICARKKIDSGIKLAEKRCIEYILAVRWMDVTAYLRITSEMASSFEVTQAGRKDRNDKADMEPCYMIPVQGFTDLPIEARL